jgi:EAL domain-containing protein (putative c-di-GMP-specific phosphodiesterase class I)
MLSRPFTVENRELRLSFKCGIALFPGDGGDAETLLKNAEAALKKTRASGERYLFYAPQMNARVAEILGLENKLRVAIAEQQFVLHYQPCVDLKSNRMTGMEALMRWDSPELGLMDPSRFIPILEETGLIIDAGKWVLEKAMSDYERWLTEDLQPLRIAVNISALQLRQKDFTSRVEKAFQNGRGGLLHLDLEITESVIMEDIERYIPKLQAIKEMGVGIAIDDFGTGYSSLSYLAKLPVTALKIDRSFVENMVANADSMAIVSTIISLAHALNLKVIAEGVEAEDQLHLLKLLKCDEIQGYLFSRPKPPEEIEALFRLEKAGPGV